MARLLEALLSVGIIGTASASLIASSLKPAEKLINEEVPGIIQAEANRQEEIKKIDEEIDGSYDDRPKNDTELPRSDTGDRISLSDGKIILEIENNNKDLGQEKNNDQDR